VFVADRWQRLNELFHAAVAVDPAQRASFVEQACAGDAALRAELEALLRADASADHFLEADAIRQLPLDEPGASVTGRPFGPYRVLNEIGRGGMGAVFLAERADGQFQQRVAIKVIKRGMDTTHVLERFRAERQILASLDHPHVARLLDGGTTDDGLPYFVMEYIQGQPIDEYVDAQRLPVRDRLALFLQVCEAVSYAHRHLIVHRDIKPQNILVTASGVPKLLDFGIAKVLEDSGDDGTSTMSALRLLTPDYASPEQVEGRQTTTQTDVYSLGVVLFELLTGRSPYRPKTWSTPAICESVLVSDVLRPSTAVGRPATDANARGRRQVTADRAAATGAASLERLRLQLRGDLDAIVLAALRKEPERRYGSVEQYASDIRRHLNGLPVRVREDSLWYRGAKFVRRHRVAAGLAALVGVVLIGGSIATAWQAREASRQAGLARVAQARAERRFSQVRKLANALLFEYHDAIKDLPGATPVRERLVRDALDYLNQLAQEAGGDPSLQRELAIAYRKVAEVQGGTASGASLGDTSGAIQSHRKSIAILESVLTAQPHDARVRWDLAEGTLELASVLGVTDDTAEASRQARRAHELYEPLVSTSAPTLDQRLAAAGAYDVNGVLLLESGNPREALALHERQLRLLESAPAADRRDPRLRRALSIAQQHIGDAQGTFGDQAAALASFEKSRQLRAELSAEFPNNTDYRALLSVAHYWEADTLTKLGRHRDALDAYRRSLAISEELAAADPKRHSPTFGLMRVGNLLAKLGDHEQALGYYRRAEALSAREVAADPGNLWKRAALIEVRASTCASLAGLARHAALPEACGGAVTNIEQTTVEPSNAVVRASLARSCTAIADAYVRLAGDRRSSSEQRLSYTHAARGLYEKSVAIWADMRRLAMLTASDEAEADAVAKSLAATGAALARAAGPPR
jgi:non-specific serine/threonine protein kinase/serine/threonine-protein kinase